MGQKTFTFVLVVVVGVLLGVAAVKQQTDSPLLREIVSSQTTIINNQSKFESKLNAPSTNLAQGGPLMNQITLRLQALEGRVTSLEGQLQLAKTALQQARQQAPAPVRQAPPPEDLSKVYTIDVAHSPVIGNKDAPVTIVEFVDFQCPFCARFHPPVAEVLKAYPDKVKYMVKNFPLSFHPKAKPASKAAFAAAEQGKYQEMVDELLENGNQLSDEKFQEIAKNIGLNVKKFMKDYTEKDAEYEKRILADIALGGKVGVRGTPSFYINGRKTSARDFPSWKKEVDAILNQK